MNFCQTLDTALDALTPDERRALRYITLPGWAYEELVERSSPKLSTGETFLRYDTIPLIVSSRAEKCTFTFEELGV